MPLEEEELSESESASGDEGTVSGQDVADDDFQCPREEDTLHLTGNSASETYRFLIVRSAYGFAHAQVSVYG